MASSSSSSSSFNHYEDEYNRIAALHALPTFVSSNTLIHDILPGTVVAMMIVTFVFVSTIVIVHQWQKRRQQQKQQQQHHDDQLRRTQQHQTNKPLLTIELNDDDAIDDNDDDDDYYSSKSIYYIAYKVAHFVGNTAIGLLGLYYYLQQNHDGNTLTVEEIATGMTWNRIHHHHHHHDATTTTTTSSTSSSEASVLYPWLACVQMGKNLWAIPVGLLLVEESILKMGHHVSVILVALASSSFTMGFQYYIPLMFGMFELSSIPLAVVETFKDNPHLQQKYPTLYTMVRLTFALSFLYIRWYLFLPSICHFLRLCAFAIYSFEPSSKANNATDVLYIIIMIVAVLTWMACCFLAALQVYWGCIIVRNMVKSIFGPSRRKSISPRTSPKNQHPTNKNKNNNHKNGNNNHQQHQDHDDDHDKENGHNGHSNIKNGLDIHPKSKHE